VPNMLQNALKNRYTAWKFCDNIAWPGHAYTLHDWGDFKIIDSAQQVDRDQFRTMANDDDLMIFSFFPTKPVGSCDGGMVVSNNKEKIERLRLLANDGFSNVFKESWNRKHEIAGYKMYMNSFSAFIALKNLERLEIKKTRLQDIRNLYNERFGIKNTSDHLYRISVSNNRRFIKQAEQAGLTCGIHYNAEHLNGIYKPIDNEPLPLSVKVSNTTVSIPFNEALNKKDVDAVINFVLHEFENY
jgi:dTDP-4-amino-4,6-dideoxygalactose transaminase